MNADRFKYKKNNIVNHGETSDKMKRIKIVNLLQYNAPKKNVTIMGWVKTKRDAKGFSFLEINDGSCLKNIQVVADSTLADYEETKKITTGSAVRVTGSLITSPGKGQKWELKADNLEILGIAPDTFPLQKKTAQRRVFKNHRSFKAQN